MVLMNFKNSNIVGTIEYGREFENRKSKTISKDRKVINAWNIIFKNKKN